jgi:uncharacterized membrane protein
MLYYFLSLILIFISFIWSIRYLRLFFIGILIISLRFFSFIGIILGLLLKFLGDLTIGYDGDQFRSSHGLII